MSASRAKLVCIFALHCLEVPVFSYVLCSYFRHFLCHPSSFWKWSKPQTRLQRQDQGIHWCRCFLTLIQLGNKTSRMTVLILFDVSASKPHLTFIQKPVSGIRHFSNELETLWYAWAALLQNNNASIPDILYCSSIERASLSDRHSVVPQAASLLAGTFCSLRILLCGIAETPWNLLTYRLGDWNSSHFSQRDIVKTFGWRGRLCKCIPIQIFQLEFAHVPQCFLKHFWDCCLYFAMMCVCHGVYHDLTWKAVQKLGWKCYFLGCGASFIQERSMPEFSIWGSKWVTGK